MQMLRIDTFESDAQKDECRLDIGTARPGRVAITSDVNSFEIRQELKDFAPLLKQILVDIAGLPLDNELPGDGWFSIRTVRVEDVGDRITPTSRARTRNICAEGRCSW